MEEAGNRACDGRCRVRGDSRDSYKGWTGEQESWEALVEDGELRQSVGMVGVEG